VAEVRAAVNQHLILRGGDAYFVLRSLETDPVATEQIVIVGSADEELVNLSADLTTSVGEYVRAINRGLAKVRAFQDWYFKTPAHLASPAPVTSPRT
jgi:hypothetical protein